MVRLFFVVGRTLWHFFRKALVWINGGENCVVCGEPCTWHGVCSSCEEEFFISPFVGERCSVCGKALVSEDTLCMQCRDKRILFHTDIVLPLFSYRLWNKTLLFRWKIAGERNLSEFFADIFSSTLRKFFADDFAIVPVPPRKGKIHTKGWDQIEDVCYFLEKKYGFKIFRLLFRESNQEQKQLGREGRVENIGKSYRMKNESSIKKIIQRYGYFPKKVILIDDVLTTGASIESCARALKDAGVQTVNALTLFIVD